MMNIAIPVSANAVPELACFAARGWLAQTNKLLRSRIINAGRKMSVVRGERLFSVGASPGGIYGVITGGIGAEGSSRWHTPRLGHIMRSGHWFGHGPLLHGGHRTMGFFATEDSTLLTVSLEEVRNLMRDEPEIAQLVGRMANMSADLAISIVCDLLIPQAPRRIAAVLLRVTGAHEGVEPSNPIGFHLTQFDISDMANVSRLYVNRVLNQFVKAGWIVKSYGHLRLLDVNALEDFAYLGGDQ
jgi:CRP/FNR family transcriptional regulator, cyclic AMP receptor protein